MIKGLGAFISVPIVSSLLAACGGDDDDDPAPQATATTGSTAGGDSTATTEPAESDETPSSSDETPESSEGSSEGTSGGSLRVGVELDAISLDPYDASQPQTRQIYISLYDTLVTQDYDAELLPGLAESWEIVTPTSWSFKIREGVTFHSGNTCDAAAIKAYFDRVANPDTPGRSASTFQPIEEIVAEGNELIINLTAPNSVIAAALSHPAVAISDTAKAEEVGETFGTQPSGTGPFRFKEWRPNEFVAFVRNDDYWGEKALLDELTFRIIPENSTRVLAFERGEIDFLYQPPGELVERLKGDSSIQVMSDVSLRTVYIGVNSLKEPFMDPLVRTALAHAVDKETIAEFVLEGIGAPAEGFISPKGWGYADVGLWEYDPDQTGALLTEAGWERNSDGIYAKDGQLFETSLWVSPEDPKNLEIAEALQAEWGQLGIRVDIQVFELAAFVEELKLMEHQLYIYGSTVATGDIDHQMNLNWLNTGETPPANRNYTGMNNQEINDLTIEGRTESDPAARMELYRRAQEVLKEEVPWIPLYHALQIAALKENIHDFQLHPNLSLWFHNTWMDPS